MSLNDVCPPKARTAASPAAPQPDRRTPLGPTGSDAIGVARVLCILGIVYVHAWTGLTGPQLAAADATAQGRLRWALAVLLGRSAVPLLSLISGWLAAGSLGRRGAWPFIVGKARTVALPMALWNGLAILLVGGAASLGWIVGPKPTGLAWTLDELLCATRPDDINVQMPFLRDLFLCLLAAPLINRLGLRGLAALALAAMAWSLWNPAFPLLLRPSILMFFTLGLMARRGTAPAWIAARPLAWWAAPYAALAVVNGLLATGVLPRIASQPLAAGAADLLLRVCAALFFWSLAWRLAQGRWRAQLVGLEPYIFMLFCAHLILIWLGGPLLGALTGPLGAPLYPVFLVVQPLLVLGATILLAKGIKRLSPRAAAVLSGGRLEDRARATTPRTSS